MFAGPVTFKAEITGTGIKFDPVECRHRSVNPAIADLFTAHCADGKNITFVTRFVSVSSREKGHEIALRATLTALNRVCFFTGASIEDPMLSVDGLIDMNPPPGFRLTAALGAAAPLFISGTADAGPIGYTIPTIRAELERNPSKAERHYGLFRSALLSKSHVERFMHLYNILMMIFCDSRESVDRFIFAQKKSLPKTQHPKEKKGVMESLYSRLRNEFAHDRKTNGLDKTKAEMEVHWGGVRDVTRKAVEIHCK